MKNSGLVLALLFITLLAAFSLLIDSHDKVSRPSYHDYLHRHRAEERLYLDMRSEMLRNNQEYRVWWEKSQQILRDHYEF